MKKNFLMKVLLTLEISFILIGSIVTLTHIKMENVKFIDNEVSAIY